MKTLRKLLSIITSMLAFLVIAYAIFFIQDKLRLLRPKLPEMEFELNVNNEEVTLPENPIEYSGVTSEGVGPGDYHPFNPSITSTANEPGYAMITITQPLLTEAAQTEFQEGWEVELPAPLYKIEPNSGWELIDNQIVEDNTGHTDYISTTYAYTETINPGEKITLCNHVQMQGITIPTYAYIDDLQLHAQAYLFATDDLEDMTWPERWEKIKDMIQ